MKELVMSESTPPPTQKKKKKLARGVERTKTIVLNQKFEPVSAPIEVARLTNLYTFAHKDTSITHMKMANY